MGQADTSQAAAAPSMLAEDGSWFLCRGHRPGGTTRAPGKTDQASMKRLQWMKPSDLILISRS